MKQCLFSSRDNQQLRKKKTKKAMEKHHNLGNNNIICKKTKPITPDAKNYWLSSQEIWDFQDIRNIILDHLSFSNENYSLFMFYGNHNYFISRLNISKTDIITIYQKQSPDCTFRFLIQFHSLFKAIFGQHQFQKLLQIPLTEHESHTEQWYLCGVKHSKHELRLHFIKNKEIIFKPILDDKQQQFCHQFQIPWENMQQLYFSDKTSDSNNPRFDSVIATNSQRDLTFTLNKQKKLTLHSCKIEIFNRNTNFHTQKLLPSLRKVKIMTNNTPIEIHVDHNPNNSMELECWCTRPLPPSIILLNIKIPFQNFSINPKNHILKTYLLRKFPIKFQTEEIAFISKFKKPSYSMPNFKCITEIDCINKGIIEITINLNTYYIILKHNSYFQCIGFASREDTKEDTTRNSISFSTSEIPSHWRSLELIFQPATLYKIKWDTIPSNLNSFKIDGGIMQKANDTRTSTINWADIPREFKFSQRSDFLEDPIQKFNFLHNLTIIKEDKIRKKSEFFFMSTTNTPFRSWNSLQINTISINISKFNEISITVADRVAIHSYTETE